jgi:hypothetical protein
MTHRSRWSPGTRWPVLRGPGRWSPRWPVLSALAVPRNRVVAPRSRLPSGKRLLFLDGHQWLARYAARATRASPSEMTNCFFSSLKTLVMLTEATQPLAKINVPGFLVGRFWVTPEDQELPLNHYLSGDKSRRRRHDSSGRLQEYGAEEFWAGRNAIMEGPDGIEKRRPTAQFSHTNPR